MAEDTDLRAQLEEKDREIAELRSRLEGEVGTLNRLIEITALLNTTLNLDELLGLIMSSATELVGAETSSLFLLDDEANELEVAVATGEPGPAMTAQRIPADAGIAGWVVQNAEAAIVDDPRSDPRFFGGSDERTGFETRSILAVPLRAKERVVGCVEVINKREGGFSQDDLRLATALADQAGTAIDNSRLYAKLADAVVASRLSYRL